MADLIGMDIGRYHIVAPLGEGGMATVYKAFDTRLEREVAIKFIRTGQIPSDYLEKIQKRFEREAKRMAKFTHPNIVQIIDYGEHAGTPYLVMPFLAGGTLKDRMKARMGKPMPYQEAARLLAPVARALDYAHKQETIHRDVKPANILLTDEGQPMLSDFGVAKILDLEEGNTLTGTGAGVGTPEYMAPEQWLNKVVPQTDEYALGVVLYEMVTGRKPYLGDTPAAVMLKQNNDPLPRPKQFVPELPDEVEQVLYKALAKDPQNRYADMGAFGAALEKLAQGTLSPALHPQAGVGNETTIDYASTAQPLPSIQDEPYRTVSFAETSSAEPQSTWIGMRSEPQQTKPQPPKLMVEQGKKPSGIAGWVWGVFVITAIVIGVLALLLANMATHPPATEASQQTVPKQEPGNGETRTSQKDGMVSVFVPAGEFLMGSTQAEADAAWKECGSGCDKKWFDGEVPQHKVDLDGYWMDKTEVTNAMYQKCVADGTCKDPVGGKASSTHTDYYGNSQYANYPVVHVDWNQSQAYCQWAGGKLPSEAEWEKAARGTDGRTYPWGDASPDNSMLNYNQNVGDTTEVGKYPSGASPYGVLDMSGNVWEWVNDWYAADYYANSAQKNPAGPGSGELRVVRGGSWSIGSSVVRAAYRIWFDPVLRNFIVGFRCVR